MVTSLTLNPQLGLPESPMVFPGTSTPEVYPTLVHVELDAQIVKSLDINSLLSYWLKQIAHHALDRVDFY